MTQQTFAVIGSDGVYLSEGGRMALPAFQQLAYWLDAMSRRHIETLWLHPSMGWRWRDADIDACDPWVIDGSGGDDGGDPYWTATRTGAYGVKRLVQPLWEDRAPWHASPDAASLRDALLTFRAAVGFDWWRGPGANGTRLLRTLHSGAHATKLDLPGDPPPPAKDGLANDTGHLHWVRPLAEHERGGYLQSFDVNGQYLAACNGLKLGVGQAQHHTRTELPTKLTDWPAGYYRVKVAEKPVKGPAPSIMGNQSAWVTTPTLRLLSESGAALHIVESWTWAESKRYLDPWYKALRQARVMCAEDPVALGAIKAMYKHPITWMASTKWDRTGDTLYRPDWYHTITAQARANVLRTVYRVGGAYDIWPLAVGSDCLYYVTPTPDPVAPFVTPLCGGSIAPTDGIRLSPALGQYKVKDAGVPIAEIAPLLRGKQWNLTALQEALNKRRAHSAVGAA